MLISRGCVIGVSKHEIDESPELRLESGALVLVVQRYEDVGEVKRRPSLLTVALRSLCISSPAISSLMFLSCSKCRHRVDSDAEIPIRKKPFP
jgi:hypothetical protein